MTLAVGSPSLYAGLGGPTGLPISVAFLRIGASVLVVIQE